MFIFLYTILIFLYRNLILIASPFNSKAKKMLDGRKNIFEKLKIISKKRGNSKLVWFHAASLGEFEQGRPVIEKLKLKYPQTKILLTFFSPSGYEIQKNYEHADFVFYLPFDFYWNAKKFIEIVKPDVAVFIKYEFWLNFLNELHIKKIPTYLISAIFHSDQPFFRWYGKKFITALHTYKHVFVQDKISYDLLNLLNIKNKTIAGDTRFDRVIEIAKQPIETDHVACFCKNEFTLIAGSSWEKDEQFLIAAFKKLKISEKKIKLIIAPHEINKNRISQIKKLLNKANISFSVYTESISPESEVLILNTIGMLSSVYRYGSISIIGGGFGDGIHSILEAAVYGQPVLFGPKHCKFFEAQEMITNGTAFEFMDENQLYNQINLLYDNPEKLKTVAEKAKTFVYNSAGASNIVIEKIEW